MNFYGNISHYHNVFAMNIFLSCFFFRFPVRRANESERKMFILKLQLRANCLMNSFILMFSRERNEKQNHCCDSEARRQKKESVSRKLSPRMIKSFISRHEMEMSYAFCHPERLTR